MDTVIRMYVSLAPCIFSGILNMAWCRLPVLPSLAKPIDSYKVMADSRRVFGDNKTWKGFWGYVLWNCLFTVLWGIICAHSLYLSSRNYLYANFQNTIAYNAAAGICLGLAYSLFELPNSFIKRRLGIEPGRTSGGAAKVFFVIMDQADSIFGCVLVLSIVYKMSLPYYFLYVAVGSLTHIIINMLLYLFKLRKNMF